MWTYDNAGNILSRTEYAYTTGSLESATPTDTVLYTYGDDEWGDLLTAYDGTAISYDNIGNPLSDGTWTYAWEHGRQLSSMTAGETTWSYTYSSDGLRTGRTNGTDTYEYVYYSGLLQYMEVNGTPVWFTHAPDGTPLSLTTGGQTYFYVTNLQGDVVGILDATGNLLVAYTYDAWGNSLTTTGPQATTLGTLNPLRYRGYVYDTETGLYYLQSRYYNPEIGRFLNADAFTSTGQGLIGNNMFAYCLNNPIVNSDTLGYYACGYDECLDQALLYGSSGYKRYISKEEREFYAALKKYNSNSISFFVDEVGNDPNKLNVTFYPDSGRIHIENSYSIKSRSEKLAVIYTIMRNSNYDPEIYGNDIETMLMEWSGHNFVFKTSSNCKLFEDFYKWRGFDDPIGSTRGVDFRKELSPSQRRNYELVTLWGELDW